MRFRGFVFVISALPDAISAVERRDFRLPSFARMREEQKGDSR